MVDRIRRWNGTVWVDVYDKDTLLPRNGALPMLGDLTLFRDPTSILHAVTKQYADELVLQLAWKDSVHLATTTNITLAGTAQVIDGYTTPAGIRVLVKNQTTLTENGIYDVKSGAWVRSWDCDSAADITTAAVFVSQGYTQSFTAWVCTAIPPITMGTTQIQWNQFGGSNFTVEMADGIYVHNVGDTMSGGLNIDTLGGGEFAMEVMKLTANNQVQIGFASDRDNNGIVQDRALINVSGTEDMMLQTFTVSGGTGRIDLVPRGVTSLSVTSAYAASRVQLRAVSTNPQAMLVGGMTAGGVAGGYIGFYPASDETILGTRQGYIGYPSSATMTLRNDDIGGVSIVAAAGGNVGLTSSLGNVSFSASAAAGIMTFAIGGTTRFRIDSGGVDVTGGLTTTSTLAVTGAITATGGVTAAGTLQGSRVFILSTSGSTFSRSDTAAGSGLCIRLQSGDNNPYLDFVEADGSPRYGYLLSNTNETRLQSESDLSFFANNVERIRQSGTATLIGKAATNLAAAGVEILGAGSTSIGGIYSTTSLASTRNLYLRHISGANATGENYLEFYSMSGTTTVFNAYIEQTGNTGIKIQNGTIVAPSDYRWKDDLGPIVGALDSVMQLRPKRLRWKESGIEFDGFIAHEAQPVVPYLVSGEKDAVTDDGQIKGQGFEYGGLSTLLAAAIQELRHEMNERLEALENR